MNNAWEPEFERLLTPVLDGRAEPADLLRLDKLLAENPAAMNAYVALMQVDAMLRWRSGLGTAAERRWADAASAVGEKEPQPAADRANTALQSAAAVPLAMAAETSILPIIIHDSSPLYSSPFALQPFVGSPVFSYGVATLIVGAAVLFSWVWRVSEHGPIARSQPAVPAIQKNIGPTLESVGQVTGMADCRWTGPAVRTGDSVHLGGQYALAAGLLEISYETGARVILQGPCTYEVDSQRGGYLSLGKLTARMETKGEGGRGKAEGVGDQKSEVRSQDSPFPLPPSAFTVRTPTAIVTDLGTEFGVEVDRSGATRSHVFQGRVELRVASPSGKGSPRVFPLGENESARVEAGARRAVTVTRGTARASSFPRQMPRRVAIKTFNTGWELKEGQPDPHWQLVARSDNPQLKPQPAVVAQYEHWEVNVPEQSQWISIPGDLQSIPNNVTYTFRTSFELAGLQPGGATLRGWFIADNHINAIRLNGRPVAVPEHPYNPFDRFHQFGINTGFVEGTNTLEFDVFNGIPPDVLQYPSGPMGLRVELEGFYVSTGRGLAATQDHATESRKSEGNRQPPAASAGKEISAGGTP